VRLGLYYIIPRILNLDTASRGNLKISMLMARSDGTDCFTCLPNSIRELREKPLIEHLISGDLLFMLRRGFLNWHLLYEAVFMSGVYCSHLLVKSVNFFLHTFGGKVVTSIDCRVHRFAESPKQAHLVFGRIVYTSRSYHRGRHKVEGRITRTGWHRREMVILSLAPLLQFSEGLEFTFRSLSLYESLNSAQMSLGGVPIEFHCME